MGGGGINYNNPYKMHQTNGNGFNVNQRRTAME